MGLGLRIVVDPGEELSHLGDSITARGCREAMLYTVLESMV